MPARPVLVATVATALALAAASTARADRICVVADPSGTPLNVRSQPDGVILGALHNGAAVRLIDVTSDGAGRPWAFIQPRRGKAGWVYRRYLDCD